MVYHSTENVRMFHRQVNDDQVSINVGITFERNAYKQLRPPCIFFRFSNLIVPKKWYHCKQCKQLYSDRPWLKVVLMMLIWINPERINSMFLSMSRLVIPWILHSFLVKSAKYGMIEICSHCRLLKSTLDIITNRCVYMFVHDCVIVTLDYEWS